MPQRFSPGQRAKLNQLYVGSSGSVAASQITGSLPSSQVSGSFPTSQIARDGGLPVTAVNTTSFLTVFAAAGSGSGTPFYWGAWADSKASGTAGGSFTKDAWRTRTLNSERANVIAGASLASNQITLPAGTYLCLFAAPAHKVGLHVARLYDTTAAAALIYGFTAQSAGTDVTACSIGFGAFTLASGAVVELQHYSEMTQSGDGMGKANSFGDPEIYSQVLLLKVT